VAGGACEGSLEVIRLRLLPLAPSPPSDPVDGQRGGRAQWLLAGGGDAMGGGMREVVRAS
jgi:hypothetical protein